MQVLPYLGIYVDTWTSRANDMGIDVVELEAQEGLDGEGSDG